MAVRAVVFDLFDTLVDLDAASMPRAELGGRRVPYTLSEMHACVSEHCAVAADDFLALMREIDAELRATRYAEHREVPSDLRFGTLVERLGIPAAGLTERLVRTHMRGLRGQVRAVDHHPEVLARLRRSARTGLCSNFSHAPTALDVLADSRLDVHLDAVVISEQVGIRKPRAEIFAAALDALGAAPHETLHVGDDLEADIRGAAEAGLRTVWITRRVADPDAALARYDGPRPDRCITDLAELPDVVAALSPAA